MFGFLRSSLDWVQTQLTGSSFATSDRALAIIEALWERQTIESWR
jgi:hypothetical protein